MAQARCKISSLFRAFGREESANVAVAFALATVPLMGFVGAAVDYSHANSVKAAMQAAADSTALMLSKEVPKMSGSQIQEKGNEYFKALFNRPEVTGLAVTIVHSTQDGPRIAVNASGDVKSDFMGMFGLRKMKVHANSVARWGTTKLQVALALDVTGSMAWDNKLPALKTATKALLATLQDAATNHGDIQVSIVPFAQYVRVDPNNWNKAWIDWTDWDENNGEDASTTACTKKRGKNGKTTKKCEQTTTWVPDHHNTWNGCITDRDQDFDVKNATPSSATPASLFPAEQANDCPATMLELTHNWIQLKKKIDDLQPAGMTNQGIGLAWAWMSLTPGAPLNPPPKTADMEQAIILFSDGLNTQNRWYDEQAKIDARQAIACANAKATGITIYTVLVNSGYSKVMKDCASRPEYYFEITTGQTVSAFNTIATSLTKLRIAQ